MIAGKPVFGALKLLTNPSRFDDQHKTKGNGSARVHGRRIHTYITVVGLYTLYMILPIYRIRM